MKLDTHASLALFAISISVVACGDDFASHPSALVNAPVEDPPGAVIGHDAGGASADGANLTALVYNTGATTSGGTFFMSLDYAWGG